MANRFPGDVVESRFEIRGIKGATELSARVVLYVGGKEVTRFDDLRIGIIPDKNLAVRFTDRARRMRERKRAQA